MVKVRWVFSVFSLQKKGFTVIKYGASLSSILFSYSKQRRVKEITCEGPFLAQTGAVVRFQLFNA